jgi:arginyl-tRNA synthetase
MTVGNIRETVVGALRGFGIKNPEVALEHPADAARGDYAMSAALVYAKRCGKSPKEVAEDIARSIVEHSISYVEKVEVVGGFVNVFLTKEFFVEEVGKILKEKDKFGENKNLAGKKVLVEYTDPNPFKEFHIGHLMSNTIGESVARLLQYSGAEVRRACYQGDVGLHVAKALWGYLQGEHEWGRAYAEGSAAYEADEGAKKEINKLNKKIYSREDEKVNAFYDEGRRVSLEAFGKIYEKLGTKFDYFFFESETGEFGKRIVEQNLGQVFERSEGAVVFPESKSGLHTRVFINSQGLPTYEAKELGLAKIKYEKYPYDLSVIITGNEINEYFRVLLAAMARVFPALAEKTRHLSHGMLRLPSGKMSSRKGNVVTAEALLGEVEKRLPEGGNKDAVAVSALKYSILRQHIGADVIFDTEKSISLHGDSGPYLQYSYARARSVLRKAGCVSSPRDDIFKSPRVAPSERGSTRHFKNVSRSEPTILERVLCRFGEVVERAAREYAPHYLATYLIELAGAFNHWYAHERILEAGEETPYRLALTEAFSIVMKNGLWLLGISAPEKM